MAEAQYESRIEFERALMEALGLEGLHVRKVEMTFEAGKPVTMVIYRNAAYVKRGPLLQTLQGIPWHNAKEITMPDETCAQCGRGLFSVPNKVLYRTNPLGEKGIYKCGDCYPEHEKDPIIEDIVDAVKEYESGT